MLRWEIVSFFEAWCAPMRTTDGGEKDGGVPMSVALSFLALRATSHAGPLLLLLLLPLPWLTTPFRGLPFEPRLFDAPSSVAAPVRGRMAGGAPPPPPRGLTLFGNEEFVGDRETPKFVAMADADDDEGLFEFRFCRRGADGAGATRPVCITGCERARAPLSIRLG